MWFPGFVRHPSDGHEVHDPALEMVEPGGALDHRAVNGVPIPAFGRGVPVELAEGAGRSCRGREVGEPVGGRVERPDDLAVEQSDRRIP